MSLEALRWAFRVPMAGAAKAVLVALADHADDNGSCWPAVARLELWSGLKERAIRNAIRELENAGLVVVIRSSGRAANRYRLQVGDAPTAANGASGAGLEVVNGASGAGLEVVNGASGAGFVDPNGASGAGFVDPNGASGAGLAVPTVHLMHPNPHCTDIEPEHVLVVTHQDEQPTMQQGGRRKRSIEKTQLPDGWSPGAAGVAYAVSKGMPPDLVDSEAERFRLHHRAKGNRFKSWPAAWQTWCLNHQRFAAERARQEFSPAGSRGVRRAGRLADAMGALAGDDGFRGTTIEHRGGNDGDDPDAWRRGLPHGTVRVLPG